MNNISGFSGALVASNPLLASEPKTGGDSAGAPKGQSFETLLTGLSQQSGTTTTDSSSTADMLTGQGGAASASPGSDALALVKRATSRETSQTASASQASGTAKGQNQATVLSATVSTERLVASAAALDVAGDGAPSQETSSPAQASGRPQGQKAASITLSMAMASKPQPSTVSTQSSGAQTQPNIVSVNASSQQLASAAADPADTASTWFAPLAEAAAASSSSAATSMSQKSTESGQASSPRERRQSTDASQTQSQPAVSVTAAALLAAAANVVPAAGAQQTVSADSGPSSSADDSAALGSGGSSLAGEAAVTKVALASHGAASKSDSTEDSTTQTKVDVVSQATYFAPVASLSPAQQIVNAVVPLLSSSDIAGRDSSATSSAQSATPATDISAMLAAAQPSSSAVKTLDLQLEPPDLGTVNVKLNLSDGGLEVEVQTSQSTTRDLLEKDKQELTNRLSGTGYTITGIDVSLAAPSSAASSFADQSAAGQSSSGQTPGGSGQGTSGSQAQDGGANDSSQRQSQRQSGNGTYETARSAPRRTAGAGLYI